MTYHRSNGALAPCMFASESIRTEMDTCVEHNACLATHSKSSGFREDKVEMTGMVVVPLFRNIEKKRRQSKCR